MNIKERIEKIQQYFKEMQITTVDGNQVIYVVVRFPRNWIIDNDLESKFGVTVSQGTNMSEYYFCTDIDSGEDIIFDAIDYNIEKMKEAIERAQLLAEKTRELRALFENENVKIESLRTLQFTYNTENDELMCGISSFLPKQSSSEIVEEQEEDEKNEKNKEYKSYKKNK